MCNLYTTKARAADVAAAFRAQLPINFNAGEGDVYPAGRAWWCARRMGRVY